jgi:hypothetical protein
VVGGLEVEGRRRRGGEKIQGGREEERGKTRHFHPVLIEGVVFVFM